jgi:short-subunit dehydrogenase
MAVLIVGATRGLGAELAKQYANQGQSVYATSRSASPPDSDKFPSSIKWLTDIDLMQKDVGDKIADQASRLSKLDTVVCTRHFRTNIVVH